ncbi:SAM-dependent methyltransferase [Nonomuraea rubra]|uniref:SAM-dependent methyltransferase n=1 Tax=Nonomuraea rubra TaxID=46180 RepID=UPI003CD06A8E
MARLYDYLLGGKDHFPADRAAAEQILEVAPELRAAARAGRSFLGRAVRFLAGAGVGQFLDIGTGLPARGNVHELAPGARVVYVDRDPVVLVHARALLTGQGETTVVRGDLREPEALLKDPDVLRALDFDRPVGLLLSSVMHYVEDCDGPEEIVATLRDALAPGSYLVLSPRHQRRQGGGRRAGHRGLPRRRRAAHAARPGADRRAVRGLRAGGPRPGLAARVAARAGRPDRLPRRPAVVAGPVRHRQEGLRPWRSGWRCRSTAGSRGCRACCGWRARPSRWACTACGPATGC